MSRAVVLGLTLLVGVFAVFVLWRTPARRGGIERVVIEGAQEERAEPDAVLALPSGGESLGIQAPGPAVDAAAGRADSTPAAQRSAQLDARQSISGMVRVRDGIPEGEVVKVRAEVFPKSGSGGAQKPVTRVAEDGTFTLVVPENTIYAELDLESRFLVLRRAVMARPGETDVMLEPLVYASIEGEVVPPQSLSTLGVSWADMDVSWSFDLPHRSTPTLDMGAMLSQSRHKPVEPDHDGGFTLSFVPVGVELDLRAENPFGPEWVQRIEPLAPAERRRITIALELGIAISGRVIDEHGLPVEGVQVSTGPELTYIRWDGMPMEPPKTDADGRFVLDRLPRRITKISTGGLDLVRGAEATVDGTTGDVLGVVLSVVRGGCIEGTVVWADNGPVEDFMVNASSAAEFRRGQGQDGRFRLSGLGEGSYRVEVRAKGDGVVGTATALDVHVGAASLELVLEEERACEVRGVVVDRVGTPIERFSVSATGPAPEFRNESVDGYGGRLLMTGLTPGEWSFEVSASGYQYSAQQVVVREGMAPLRFELMPAGRIRGTVVDAAGVPVSGAWVGEEGEAFMATLVELPDGTDAEGRFDIETGSTRLRLLAIKKGFSPSSVVEIEVAPGENVEGIVLHLGESCRVSGRVLDEYGEPMPGAGVFASAQVFLGSSSRSDAKGLFELDGLPSGPMALLARHPTIEGALASATVTLVPGRSCSVDLRFEAADPVRLHGQITNRGKPVECSLGLRSRSFAIECTSGSDGRFEVTLQRPGDWKGVVWLGSDRFLPENVGLSDLRRFDVIVPDTDEHTFELTFESLPRLTSLEELYR